MSNDVQCLDGGANMRHVKSFQQIYRYPIYCAVIIALLLMFSGCASFTDARYIGPESSKPQTETEHKTFFWVTLFSDLAEAVLADNINK